MFSHWAFVIVGYLLAFVVILRIVLQRREPTATLAWVLGILLLPFLGVLLYLLIGRRRLDRQVRRRKALATRIEPQLSRLEEEAGTCKPDAGPDESLVRLSNKMGCRIPTCGNHVEVLVDAEVTYAALEKEISAAKNHIHFQYYIYQEDETGRRFRDLLIQKAKEGVKVRLLTDGIGSFGLESFMEPLIEAGGEFAEFLPVGYIRRPWRLNLRNHRKIVVVDGKIAFTGGVNIGDEYTGRKRRIGPWRDTHLKLKGPAVVHLQEIFAEDWYFATQKEPMDEAWFPPTTRAGDVMVQVVGSGPDAGSEPIQKLFFIAVTSAQKQIFLTTPYFVPDQAMVVALQTAALRGVDVRLMLPYFSDMRLVLHAGRSYYQELLENGVRIFEYKPGILHSKTMVVDDNWATVGSANMDMRSFRLNFEVNAVVYGPDLAKQLIQLFENDQRNAIEITESYLFDKSWKQRMAEGLARILSPVL